MSASELLQMAREGDLDAFETQCLAGLEQGTIALEQLVDPFQSLARADDRARVATLGQMVLETSHTEKDPRAALEIACVTLKSDPKNEDLRARVVSMFRQVHGERPGFDLLLETAGLESGRPARNAVRILQLTLNLQPGDALISRTEDTVVEVIDVDLESGLFTVRRGGRPNALSALDLAREFEAVDPDDFRVMRHRPEQLQQLLQTEPVRVVIGLLHAHDNLITQDGLKTELVPEHLEPKAWSKWWTKTRAALRKHPNIIIEGRSPVVLKYTDEVRTAEDETWEAFEAAREPSAWLAIIDGYVRDKRNHKEEPQEELINKAAGLLVEKAEKAVARRPSEAFACGLVIRRLNELLGRETAPDECLAVAQARAADSIVGLVRGIGENVFWPLALDALEQGCPDQYPKLSAQLAPFAPAAVLDRLFAAGAAGEETAELQAHVEQALSDPAHYPELNYWFWKGPARVEGLTLPSRDMVFTTWMETLPALGKTLAVEDSVAKAFRHRVKAALALRDYSYVRDCMQTVEADRAVTLRRQIQLIDGLGDTAQAKMLNILRDMHPALWVVKHQRIAPWEDPEVLWNSRAGIEAKMAERDELVNDKMAENAKRIGEAAALGDLSENSEYKFALEERDLLRARLAQMNQQLSLSQEIESTDVPTEHVGVGSRVVVRDTGSGEERTMTFRGPFDTNIDAGIYNYRAPFAQAMMGAEVGERVEVELDNQTVEYEVIRIEDGG